MSETLIDYCGYRWTRRDDGLWESDVGTVRAAPLMTPPTMREGISDD